ncbi:MAG: hypothetical protein ABIC95_06085, partial [archaeon]
KSKQETQKKIDKEKKFQDYMDSAQTAIDRVLDRCMDISKEGKKNNPEGLLTTDYPKDRFTVKFSYFAIRAYDLDNEEVLDKIQKKLKIGDQR